MPVYEYVCKQCGNHTEVAQSFKDEPLTVCSVCGGSLRKVFNSIGIVLKGSGFYRTDSRMPAKAEKKSETAASGTDGSKADGSKSTESKAGESKGSEAKASASDSSSSTSSSESKSTKSA